MAIAVERVRRQVQRVQVLPLNQVPVKSCPSEVCQVNGAKASERQEGSGLKGEAWRSREAQPGKVREVLEGLSRDKVESRGVGEVESSQLAQARELSVTKNLNIIAAQAELLKPLKPTQL